MFVCIYVCLSGLWLGRLLHLSFLSTFLKLVCYAHVHVFPCVCTVCTKKAWQCQSRQCLKNTGAALDDV